MESLALLATLIVSIAFLGGPLSFLLSRLLTRKGRTLSSFGKVVTLNFALPAIAVGLYLILLDIGLGARIMGAIGVTTGLLAAIRILRK